MQNREVTGVPTVVGFFAALTVAPFHDLGADFGLSVSSESALAAGMVMGVMIIPFISSRLMTWSQPCSAMRDGRWRELPFRNRSSRSITAALPGIVGGIMLAISRIGGPVVVMAAGLAWSANPESQHSDRANRDISRVTKSLIALKPAAFALGLMLFTVTLLLNIFALHIVKKYREQYE